MGRDADIPVLLYNNPGCTRVSLLPQAISGIAAEAPSVAGSKDSSGDLRQTFDHDYLSLGWVRSSGAMHHLAGIGVRRCGHCPLTVDMRQRLRLLSRELGF